MSTLSISSPGVQINEVDLSIIARPIGDTNVLVTGFAPQGPTEELVNIGSVSEFESVFGTPTSAAERYLYYTARQILSQSPANLYVTRLPYGEGLGNGYGNSYSALVYPISSNAVTAGITGVNVFNLTYAGSGYSVAPSVDIIGGGVDGIDVSDRAVAHAVIYDSTYLTNPELSGLVGTVSGIVIDYAGSGYVTTPTIILAGGTDMDGTATATADIGVVGQTNSDYTSSTVYSLGAPVSILLSDSEYDQLVSNGIDWNNQYTGSPIRSFDDIANAGLVVLNDSKVINNALYEGYYLAITDNTNVNPSTQFDCVNSIQAISQINVNYSTKQEYVTVPATRLNFKLTQPSDSFGADSISKAVEQYPLSFNFGLSSFSDCLALTLFKIRATRYSQDTVTLDYSIVESYAGSLNAGRTQNNPNGGNPISFFLDTVVNTKSNNIKVFTNPHISSTGKWTLSNGLPAKKVNVSNAAKAAFASGVYSEVSEFAGTELGQVDQKLAKTLTKLSNDDTTIIDVIVDGGLSTIWATSVANAQADGVSTNNFDENYTPEDIDAENGIGNTTVNVVPQGVTYDAWQAITTQFVAFAQGRRDHLFISDPLRQIFVRGQNGIVSKRKTYSFANNIWWPLNNLYSSIQSSYVTTYGNWIHTNDIWTSKPVWVPSSGYAAAVIAKSSQTTYPWIAPAGFNRGTLVNVLDIGVNPTQKQRDQLYKININPIAFFTTDGFVIMGQKTMYRQPSAFDRINVRRLFLTLEKETQRLLKYFVFEPNDFSTRNRLKGALVPIFDQAKLNDGCYDYLIVCDTTNNTPDVIDNNELKISIYIQPVRAAEFILADFIATRTGVNFSELISGGQS